MNTAGKIFVLQGKDTLRPLEERPFESEDIFQELLGTYPDLLAGEQINAADPRRWLLVAREFGVPDRDGAGDRWSLDHLFLDQEGIPTLVEVKRSTDTRIRREVVGQMLDYAANAVVYWPIEKIRSVFEEGCGNRQESPADRILELLGTSPEDGAVDAFWNQVGTNLLAGRIRIVFVADVIPSELRRIIEFLNGQMSPAEVLGVEIRHFAADGIRTLVPQVIGATAAAEQKKSQSRPTRQWDEESFFTELAKRGSVAESDVARRLLSWAQREKLRIWWGRGAQMGSFVPTLDFKGRGLIVFDVWTTGRLYFHFDYLRKYAAYASVESREEVAQRLGSIPGILLSPNAFDRMPAILLTALASDEAFSAFIGIVEEVYDRITRSE